MRLLEIVMYILCWIGCMGNLAFYAWASPDPKSLAIGIFCGLVAIATKPESH